MLKSRSKEYLRRMLVGSRVLDVAGRFAAPSAAILMYHSVRDNPAELSDLVGPGITHAASVFERQMEIVSRDFTPVTLEDILRCLKGEAKLPRRAVAVTFDDGFADNEEIAAPILARFGIRAAFYATVGLMGTSNVPWYCRLRYVFLRTRKNEWNMPGGKSWNLRESAGRDTALLAAFALCAPMVADTQERAIRQIETTLDVDVPALGRPLMMSWDQLRKLQRSGHIAGSHTLTHPNVAHVSDEQDARRELVESKGRMETELGTEVAHFSYPHPALSPQWSPKTLTLTAEAGYKSAVTTTFGPVLAGADPLCLKRALVPRHEDHFRWNLGRTLLGK